MSNTVTTTAAAAVTTNLDVLKELSSSQVKPPAEDVIAKLGMVGVGGQQYNLPDQASIAPSPNPSLVVSQVQKFSTVVMEEETSAEPFETVEPKAEAVPASSNSSSDPVDESDSKEETVPFGTKEPEKFSFNLVGSVPKGYGPAQSCANCVYHTFDGCSKYVFPNHPNYSCKSFELKPAKGGAYMFTKPAAEESQPEPTTAVSVESAPPSKMGVAAEAYDVVLQTFSDGDIAAQVLEQVVQRFSQRSAYADEYLRLRYRRAYETKHGSLDQAFVPQPQPQLQQPNQQ